jgi:ubiquinone/menaquinone biosynthesis C-methylase UbiE
LVQSLASNFDDQAAAYDRWYGTPLGQLVDTVEKQAIFDLMPEVQGRRILEVGCGTGNFSLALSCRGAKVIGLDSSAPMLARAHAKARQQDPSILWVRGLASHLPFADERFDGVLCVLALDFMTDREQALQEMIRVLYPGGFLSLAILNKFSLWTLKRVV